MRVIALTVAIASMAILSSTYAEGQLLTGTLGNYQNGVYAYSYLNHGHSQSYSDGQSNYGTVNVGATASSSETLTDYQTGAPILLSSYASDSNSFADGSTSASYFADLGSQSSAEELGSTGERLSFGAYGQIHDHLAFTLTQTTEVSLTGFATYSSQASTEVELDEYGTGGSANSVLFDLTSSGSLAASITLGPGDYLLAGNVYTTDFSTPLDLSDGLGSDSAYINYTASFSVPGPPPVPEPITTCLGVAGIGLAARRRAKRVST